MATLAKKIHIKNSAGTEQTVNLYSTTGEVATAPGYTFQLVDGVTAYAPLVATNHAKATSGRVLKGGTTYAWGSTTPGVAYNYSLITTAGAGTFTVPAGVNKLRVTCVGGGAGGLISHDWIFDDWHSEDGTPVRMAGEAGVATTFGSVSANGGTSPSVIGRLYSYQEDGMVTIYAKYSDMVISYGTTNGGYWTDTSNYYSGAAAVPLNLYTGAQVGAAGAGGHVDADGNTNVVMTGASGYKTVTTISATPGSVISYNVGRAGYWWFEQSLSSGSFSSGGRGGGVGTPGAILVEWGEGIQ